MDNSFEKLINRVLDGRYKIENVVGIGGMAYVLKAIDLQKDNSPVAIKILNDEFNKDENAVKRFVNESEAVSMVDSPNIVKIYDVAMSENLKYIVMEFIDGITLKDYIDKIGALGWKEAVHYVRQILVGLSSAHEKGIIHRDVKPQNMMLLRDGQVKVTDFGIAKTPTSEPLTMTDKAIGTVNYISPEQASGATVDEKSDIYSVGVMLYEMLTGVLPFTAESPVAVAMMQVSKEPVPPRQVNSQIPVGLEQIVLKAMSKNPEERFVNAAAMEKALAYFAQNPTVVFAGTNTSAISGGKKRRKKTAEEKEQSRREAALKHRSMFPIILGITLSFFTVALISGIYLLRINQDDDIGGTVDNIMGIGGEHTEVFVGNYKGRIFDEKFVEELKKKNIIAEVTYSKVFDKTLFENEIISQNKDGIRRTDKDGYVTVKFTVNPEDESSSKMLNVINSNEERAITALLDKYPNILSRENIEIIYEYNDDYYAGKVYNTIPGPDVDISHIRANALGTGVNMEITIFVSKGNNPKEVELPDVIGQIGDAVKETLSKSLNMEVDVVDEQSPMEDGTVIRVIHVTGGEENEDGEVTEIVETELEAGSKFINSGKLVLVVSDQQASLEEPDDEEPQEPTDVTDSDEPSDSSGTSGNTETPGDTVAPSNGDAVDTEDGTDETAGELDLSELMQEAGLEQLPAE